MKKTVKALALVLVFIMSFGFVTASAKGTVLSNDKFYVELPEGFEVCTDYGDSHYYFENEYSYEGIDIIVEGNLLFPDGIKNTPENIIEEKIDIQKLDYKDKVLKYMMPVEFLLDLCAITQNPGFVLALADKAINETEIVITVFQETEEKQTITSEKYQIETQTSTEKYTYNDSGEVIDYSTTTPVITTGEEQQDPQTTEIATTTNSSLKITYVNSWFSNQVYTYNQVRKPNGPQTFEELLEETHFSYTKAFKGQVTNSDNSVTKIYEKQGTRKINRKQISTISSTTITYEQGVEKQETDKIEELLEIFKAKYKLPNSVKEEAAIGKIVDGSEILFHMLSNSERTQTVEYVLKYILYVYTGNSYGITNFDLSIFKPSEFYSIVGSLYGNTVEEKVWFALLNAGCSKESTAGVLGNLWAESSFKTNNLENSFEMKLGYTDETYTEAVNSGTYTLEQFISDHTNENCGAGYGLAQWTYCSRKEGLYNYAKNKGVSIDDVDMQIEYLLGELNLSNNASGFATYVLYSRKGFEVSDWKDAATPEDAAEAFCWIFENPAGSYDTARSSKAREYYEKYKSLDDGGNFVGGSNAESIIGTFTSTVTGRTFTIFNQMKIVTDRQWNDRCNRAAQISVCSGYYNGNALDLINEVGSVAPRYTSLYTKCGLSYQNMNSGIDSTHTFDKNGIRGQIINGGYVILYVRGSEVGANGISKYGRDWASAMHWVAILGYRNNGTVEEIFVSDSGHGNTGWVPLDEFDTITASVVFVNEK